MAKRPTSTERVPITDEWGIYDPAKAGMQALYAKLGRPILRASAKSARQERRRGFRPDRTNDGVGLAIQEAMVRAGRMSAPAEPVETPILPVSPARAVRIALKAATAAVPTEPFIPAVIAPSAAGKKKTATRRAKATVAARDVEVETSARPRSPRKPAKARAKAEPAPAAVPVAVVATAAVPPAPAPPAPPAPAPRRPRGAVPLAAWAHAVSETPKPEPRRVDKRGFWKGLFRMPAEVALVEYARGCRIHRLLIETSDDVPLLDLL